ncbi:hypothetical protein [Pandoraea sp. ISTKB]|uniref:hypothetical protein n=1 Tax=Pandoraea sp. ISTKB TaxID=1586708 RepID=UPI001112FA85|nr:hypothetical protein [Pandoraea sp. ISTKB]
MGTNHSMGALEDLAMLRPTLQHGAEASEADLWAAAGLAKRQTRALKARDSRIEEANVRLGTLHQEYNDLAAVSAASRKVIDNLAEQLAAALGLSAEIVRKQAYEEMSILYDAEVDDSLAKGHFRSDPRKDPDVLARPSRDWYSPDHP